MLGGSGSFHQANRQCMEFTMSLDDLVDEAERNGGNASRILHRTYFDGRHPSETQAGPIVETTAYPPRKP